MIETKGLCVKYTERDVLSQISLSVKKGERLGIVGPNGSGKTTLVRALTKIIAPTSGTVWVDGVPLNDLSRKQFAQRCAVVSQLRPGVSMTVEQYVFLGRHAHSQTFQWWETEEDRRHVYWAMEKTDSMRLRHCEMAYLSGGEQQRVAIARALAQMPEVLFLDEPTAHLDISYQYSFMELIKNLNEEGLCTVVMVLHDLALARRYCDRLVLLDKGKIYAQGIPEEVITPQALQEVYRLPGSLCETLI